MILRKIATKFMLCAALMALSTTVLFAQSNEVVIYTSLDRQFSEPILQQFQQETGIRVRPVYDTEAVKTVGLINRLLAERNNPRADVFWNNEIIRSIQLKESGLTEAYHSPSAETLPDAMKDPDGHWHGFGARARVFLVNKDLVPNPEEWPRSLADLTDPKWKGRATFAKPLFGTTNTHVAAIWAGAGPEAAKKFWTDVFANSVMEVGNAQARDRVVEGRMAWCWTDTDDAYGAILSGANVEMIYPTGDPAGKGVLTLPNTVVLLKNSPNPENGKKLIDYILSEEVEGRLAKSRSAQLPVRESVEGPDGIELLDEDDIMLVDWQAAYEALGEATAFIDSLVEGQ